MAGTMLIYSALLQIPGMDAPDTTISEQIQFAWDEMGFMRWPLVICLGVGILVIIWKFFDLLLQSMRTKSILSGVNELLAVEQRICEWGMVQKNCSFCLRTSRLRLRALTHHSAFLAVATLLTRQTDQTKFTNSTFCKNQPFVIP